jgi:surfeit locus 1 family protein
MTASKLNWRLALFSGFFLIFFVYLGTWQLQRSHDKTEMLAAADVQAKLPGKMLDQELVVSTGERIRMRGRFDSNRVFLIDNRVFEGRVGYEVLQVFESDNGQVALVNRGFVAGERTRKNLPEVPAASTTTQIIRGHAYLTELTVPEDNVAGADSPWVIQVAKPKLLERIVGADLFEFVLRLEEASPDALPRFWPVTTMTPERHFGYAVTWYLMAIAVLAAFVFSSRADLKEEEHE